MVVFRTAVEALDFVLALHNDAGDDRIKIRAGIHVGSARIINDDIFGKMVNYTKRVESTENPEGIRLSDSAHNQVVDEKAQRHDHLHFLSKYENFKGFTAPQKVWVVIERIGPLHKALGVRIKPIGPKPSSP